MPDGTVEVDIQGQGTARPRIVFVDVDDTSIRDE